MHISRYKAELGFADLSLMEEGKEKQLLLNIAKRKIFEEQNEIKTFIEKCPLTLKGPLAITMNRKTVSTGEHFLVTMDYNNRATLVGENSYGATGNPLIVNIADDISCRITTAWSTYPNGKEYVNIGVKPHIFSPLPSCRLSLRFSRRSAGFLLVNLTQLGFWETMCSAETPASSDSMAPRAAV